MPRPPSPSAARPSGERPCAVIIGAGFGGLAAAMRLGACGWDVTIIDRLDVPGGRATSTMSDGHRFDLGPTILTDPDILRRLFLDCGFNSSDIPPMQSIDPIWTVVDERGRMLRLHQHDTVADVAAQVPGELRQWREIWAPRRAGSNLTGFLRDHLPAPRLMSWIERHLRDPRLQAALAMPAVLLGHDPRTAQIAHGLPEVMRSGMVANGHGLAAIARAMADAVAAQGGTIRLGEEVTKVSPHRACVTLKGGRDIEADAVILTAPIGRAVRKQRRSGHIGLFAWHFGTSGTTDLWPEVGLHTVLAPDDLRASFAALDANRIPEAPLVHLHRATVTDPSAAPEGGDTFCAVTPVPHLGHRHPLKWSDEAGRVRDRIRTRLETVMPGFADRVTTQMTMSPDEMRDRYLSPYGLAAPSLQPRVIEGPILRLVPGAAGGVAGALAGAEALVRWMPHPRMLATG
ncbi:Phytoene desaturase (neurosporene-forming) [Jannaschia seosinensis]|uniref:Phytoene desaturase (Neurosporene-forming) n=1 Tax=Jannaschia seosinensis TaxID=313367 RepID=A0A0M7BC81_9RHOB|nr:FAD-dependent oxidoreductase [Jannaschia seosinensis]CUH38945.1 Phytoene desaturase (neurosporene-forming) [Jannaschia seosinensis]